MPRSNSPLTSLPARSLLIGALLVSFCSNARAQVDQTDSEASQTRIEIGPRLGFDLGDIEELFAGVDARISNSAFPVVAQPALDVYFVEGGSLIQFNANVLYPFELDDTTPFRPYAGGGLGFSFVSDTDRSDVGLNLVGGALFGSNPNLTPFAQAQFTIGDFDYFAISGGILLRLGG